MKRTISLLLMLTLLMSIVSSMAEEYKMPECHISNEKITITYFAQMHALQTNLDDYKYLADLEEATNVHLDATWVPNGEYAEKKNAILAAGADELPDIIMPVNSANVSLYAPQDYFVRFDDYLSEELTPNLMDLFARYPEYKAAITSTDGHIYVLPCINMLPFRQSPYNFFINKTWLDKLGLDIPTNIEEFYNVLCAFRDNDCNGNGDTTDEIPLAGNYGGGTDYWRWISLFAMFGFPIASCDRNLVYVTEDGRVTLAPLEEGFKDALAYFKMLYTEQLLDQETFTQDNALYTGKGNVDPAVYGVYPDWFGSVAVGNNFDQYVVLPPMSDMNGNTTWSNLGTRLFYGGGGVVVSTQASDIEACIKWLDYLYMPEISLQTTRGNIGVVIYKDETDGRYHYYDDTDSFRVANVPAEAMPFAFMADAVPSVVLNNNMERKITEYYPLNAAVMSTRFLPTLQYTDDEAAELAIYATDIDNYIIKSVAAFITNQEDLDNGFDAFVKQINKMDVDSYLSIMQDAYDRFIAAMD